MHRREFIKLSGVAGGLFAVGGMGLLRASAAHAPRLAVPTVDRLVLTSAVDNIYDSVLPSVRFGSLDVRRRGVRDLLGPTPPAAEHGLALHLDSYQGDQRRQVLVDFSLTSRNLLNNYALLGIEPAEADALVLSHGHFDHWGGFLDLAGATPAWAEQGQTLYAGGEDSFCKRWVMQPDGSRLDLGQLDRDAVEARGVNVLLAKEPLVVADHALLTGQIPRLTDFEQFPPSNKLEVGRPGSDCGDTSHYLPTVTDAQEGDLVQDVFQGEIATLYHVKDRGLVVIASCGHSGIINTVRYAQQVTGIDKVHAVVGGWHLAASPDQVVKQTVDTLKQIDADYFVPMHCTGFLTEALIDHAMPNRLVEPSSGTSVVFGA
jgi:7,8-dihydropterin-6-yl-methyl-4-(beta-D-ribofuranosyl)aminobenzene 5'-phosphate synthase